MTTNYSPLDKDKHSALKVNLKHNFEFAKDTHLAATTIREFAQVASCMPIVFVKEPTAGSLHAIAMFGLEQGSNMFFQDNKWQAHVMPLSIQRFPFDVRPDGDKLGVFIDEKSDLVGESEGQPLFTEAGEPSEFLQHRHNMLSEIANSEMSTQKFIKQLEEYNLIDEVQLVVQYATGQKRNVTGLHSISEKRLNELDDEKILDLKKTGFLGAIYAVLLSISQLNRLVQLSVKTEQPIANINMTLASEAQAEKPAS
jgi:hypothetical protein